MAKDKPGAVNKSQAIRDMLAVDPNTDFKTVQAALSERGIKIGNAHFYMVKSKAGKAKRKAKREKAVSLSGGMSTQNPIAMLKKVKGLAEELAGTREAVGRVTPRVSHSRASLLTAWQGALNCEPSRQCLRAMAFRLQLCSHCDPSHRTVRDARVACGISEFSSNSANRPKAVIRHLVLSARLVSHLVRF